MRRETGVALLAVLWVLAGAGTAVALGLATVREGVTTSRYRSESTRARWQAEGCLAQFRARLEAALSGSGFSAGSAFSAVTADPWIDPTPQRPDECSIALAPPAEGPIDVNTAPESTLLALPGFDTEVVEAVLRLREWGRRVNGLDQFIAELPADLRDRVAAHYAELVGRAAFAPPAWVVTAEGVVAGRGLPIMSEWWVRAGARIAIVRREVQ
jgi:type II secretory pathway component PulK